jgi:hypothetical protein
MLEPTPTASLPLEPHEGIAAVAVADAREGAQLVTDSIRATIIRVALPAVASSLLMTLFSSVDAFWVGTRIGASGLGRGLDVALLDLDDHLARRDGRRRADGGAARRHGEGREREASRLAGDSLVFSLALGIVVAAAGLAWLDDLFAVMHTPSDVTTLGRTYLSTYLVGTPLIYGFFAIDATFRASGDTKTPFVLLLSSVAITLFLDPVLMLGIGPFPRLGIEGAAIATVGTRVGGVLSREPSSRRVVDAPRGSHSIRIGACRGDAWECHGAHRRRVQRHLRRAHADDDAIRYPALAALGIGHRVESWLVHDRRRIRRGDGGDRWAESRRAEARIARRGPAGWRLASARCLASLPSRWSSAFRLSSRRCSRAIRRSFTRR